MNSKKYNNSLYPVREATDLRDILLTSVEEFKDVTAYLEKKNPKGNFEAITYGQVGEDIAALGTKFIDMGLKGEKIAVIGDTSYKWLLTYFATVCGVGVIVPLDRNLPEDELKNLIERSGAKVLVYGGKLDNVVGEIYKGKNMIEYFISMTEDENNVNNKIYSFDRILESGHNLLEDGIDTFYRLKVEPDEFATLMFTSGTTGKSKGVMLSQRNITANVINMSRYVKVHEGDVVLSILPVHHAYAMTCVIWTTFFQGRTIGICQGLKYIQKNMVEVKANIMVGVPLIFEKMHKGMLKQAKKNGEAEKLRKAIDLSRKLKLYNKPKIMKRMFKSIHQTFGGGMNLCIAGGAAIDPKVIEDFEAMGIPMIQGYGMSENSPIIAVNKDRYSKPASVGTAMVGTEIEIIDKDEDGIGEVICKGPSVMMGYYQNEEATKETLTEDGWLKTGDLGYMDEEGFLYLTGRKKTVIVTKGGKNIFPEEIESVLLENSYIKEVIVHGVPDKKSGNIIITADIFPNYEKLYKKKGQIGSGETYYFYREIIEGFNEILPPYKTIKRLNIRDKEFDKTTTGKIKRYGNAIIKDGNEKAELLMNQQVINDKKEAKGYLNELKQSLNLKKVDKKFVEAIENMYPISGVWSILSYQAEKRGNEVAVIIDERHSVTYKELFSHVKAMGTSLINAGYSGDDIVPKSKNTYNQLVLILTVLTGVGVLSRQGKVKLDEHQIENFMKEGQGLLAKGDRQYLDKSTEGRTEVFNYGRKVTSMELGKKVMTVASHAYINENDTVNAYVGDFITRILYGLLVPLYMGGKVSLEANTGTTLICDSKYGNRIFKHCKEVLILNNQLDEAKKRVKWNKWTKKIGLSTARPIIEQFSQILNEDVEKLILVESGMDKEAMDFFDAIGIRIVTLNQKNK